MQRCNPQISAAQNVMEVKEQRQKQAQSYSLDPVDYFENRVTKIEDAIIVEKANLCMDRCKQPVEILKRLL